MQKPISTPDSFRNLVSDHNPSLLQKRKRQPEDDEVKIQSKRALKKKRLQESRKVMTIDGNLDLTEGIDTAIGQMDNRLLVDWVAQKTKRFAPDMSVVELEDLYLPGTTIRKYL